VLPWISPCTPSPTPPSSDHRRLAQSSDREIVMALREQRLPLSQAEGNVPRHTG